MFAFQFLIGRLVTYCIFASRFRSARFQFLIGRLVTQRIAPLYIYFPMFQFLIGRLVTIFALSKGVCSFKVSIPHR